MCAEALWRPGPCTHPLHTLSQTTIIYSTSASLHHDMHTTSTALCAAAKAAMTERLKAHTPVTLTATINSLSSARVPQYLYSSVSGRGGGQQANLLSPFLVCGA